MTDAVKVSPLKAGLLCRCPNCGQGPVFASFLGFADSCSVCEADFSAADAGDGPAFFVMFLVAILVTPPVLILQIVADPPVWVHILIWTPIITALSAALLRPFKSLLFALQWRHRAEEAKWEDASHGDAH